jgi:beta-N-acetylhexosaminidase
VTALAADCGQLLWVGFDGATLPAELAGRLRTGQAGGVTLFRRNIEDLDQVAALARDLHAAGDNVLISIDQEGGRVQRLRAPATEWPAMLNLSDHWIRDPGGAVRLGEAIGKAIALELAALDLDLDFAPVLDVLTNAQNPVIGDRSFAMTVKGVVELAGAVARGLAAGGVLTSGKHFPGHGDTHLDSHLALPRVDHDLARLRAVELAPFAALAGNLPTIMTAHVVFAALDDQHPATLSPAVLGLLRDELAYGGVIVSDDLEMKAIADHYGVEDAVIRGLRAGCDVFLLCHRAELQYAAHAALVAHAEKDSRVRERVRQSAARVRAMAATHRGGRTTLPGRGVIGSEEHLALARRIGDPTAAGTHWPL